MTVGIKATTVVGLVRERAQERGEALACAFLDGGERVGRSLSYAGLDAEARRVASLLADRLAPGSRAVLVYEPGLDFVAAFLGCLYAGVIAVPVFPPSPPRVDAGVALVERVVADSGAEALLASTAIKGLAAAFGGFGERLAAVTWLVTDEPGRGDPDAWRDPGVRDDDIAMLQYTSGSTAAPKGVILTHGNLIANQRAQTWSLSIPDDATMVSWLPMYHDMGLIGGLLCPLYRGSACYLMSPLDFMQQPSRWPLAVSRFGGVISGGPNFAYELTARRTTEREIAGMDLSRWEVAFCGAEPVRAATMRRFQATFAPAGFRANHFDGCYGLAESALLVSGDHPGGRAILVVDGAELEAGRVRPCEPGPGPGADGAGGGDRADPAAPGGGGRAAGGGTLGAATEGTSAARRTVELVTAGRVFGEYDLRIVDPERGVEVGPGEVGEIWLRGPSVALGYWRRPGETAATFGATIPGRDGRYLRTGDLGFVHDRQLYVTGRIKDLLIVRGRSVHPHDVEDAAQDADRRLRRGCGVAFAFEAPASGAPASKEDGGAERVALLQEATATDPGELAALARAARAAVLRAHQIDLDAVYLVPRRSVLKTSSGKVRRGPSRDALLAGEIRVLHAELAPGVGDLTGREVGHG